MTRALKFVAQLAVLVLFLAGVWALVIVLSALG